MQAQLWTDLVKRFSCVSYAFVLINSYSNYTKLYLITTTGGLLGAAIDTLRLGHTLLQASIAHAIMALKCVRL